MNSRNHPATIINYSKDRLLHKAVVMHLTTERLKDFYYSVDVQGKTRHQESNIHTFLKGNMGLRFHWYDKTK
ncbi:hypothetical protein [Chryseobacterium sp.]|uniref:hypothetical protein n=1 Tax=Chryseobacterium sp. TaxID=1871047 RepID=UPI001B1325C4|nr:hypothetical protein [Chryseobacterium sp.]MBO9693104.1 hypothetical protein [Chryseobacterium sp.]